MGLWGDSPAPIPSFGRGGEVRSLRLIPTAAKRGPAIPGATGRLLIGVNHVGSRRGGEHFQAAVGIDAQAGPDVLCEGRAGRQAEPRTPAGGIDAVHVAV